MLRKKTYNDLYGQKQIFYEKRKGLISFLYNRLVKFEENRYQICYALLPSNKKRLLDVGCSDGSFILISQKKFKECYGVDISPLRIQQAKKKVRKSSEKSNVHFYECDLDVIVCMCCAGSSVLLKMLGDFFH